jgi:hypothetical protein
MKTRVNWESLKNDIAAIGALVALLLSAISFYWSYFYTKHDLEVTVTSVSFNTNQGEMYMTVAFSNDGNRDAVLLRVEPALWSKRKGKDKAEWVALDTKVAKDVPLSDPKVPLTVKAGGVEVVRLAAQLTAEDAESATVASQGGAFLGIIVASMKSDGKLYQLEHPVARLSVDSTGHIHGAEATIHRTLFGFANDTGIPPGDSMQENEKTPFVWADQRN